MRIEQHSKTALGLTAPLPAKQRRSQQTRDTLLAAGARLLQTRTWDSLSVAEIAAAGGCSVGAFYVRFASKEAFFEALVEQVLAQQDTVLDEAYRRASQQDAVRYLVRWHLGAIAGMLNLWRAALVRGLNDPNFWEPFRRLGSDTAQRFIRLHERNLGRRLNANERAHTLFAFQMMFGIINNTMLNRPGPLALRDERLAEALERAFRLLAGC